MNLVRVFRLILPVPLGLYGACCVAQQKAPFTIEETESYVKKWPAYSTANHDQIRGAYESRGVNFIASPEKIDLLKKEGITEDFLSVIQKVAPKPLPPLPPPPQTGRIEITCVPAECAVTLADGRMVTTSRGKAAFEAVPPGEIKAIISKADYISAEKVLKVQPGATSLESVTLQPGPIILKKIAREWLSKVWEAVGAGERGSALKQISASGPASLFDASGAETHWIVSVKLSDKTPVTFTFETPAGKPAFVLQCYPCKPVKNSKFRGTGKIAIEPDEASLLMNQFRKVDLGSMVSRLTASDVDVISTDVKPSGARTFLLESNVETFEMEVGPTLLPSSVFVKPKNPGDDVYRVIYGDYDKLSDAAQYPRLTQYRMETNKRGVKIELIGAISKLN